MIVMLSQLLNNASFPHSILGWSTGRGYAFAVLFLLCATVVGCIVYLWTIRPPRDGGTAA